MNTEKTYIRNGFGAVRPYLYGRLNLRAFVKEVFGAEELLCHAFNEKEFHVEAKIGDSIVVLEVAEPACPSKTQASIYVYVEDVDATYQRAMKAGAVSVAGPEDKPYQERTAGVQDDSGNIWWIATYKGS
jgi:PhnB protein